MDSQYKTELKSNCNIHKNYKLNIKSITQWLSRWTVSQWLTKSCLNIDNILHLAWASYYKNYNGLAEISIKLFKDSLRELCLADSTDWSKQQLLLITMINQSFLRNRVNRASLFHAANSLSIFGFGNLEFQLFQEQRSEFQKVENLRGNKLA